MVKLTLLYVDAVTAKGRTYYYYRRGRKRLGRLPDDPASAEFMRAYQDFEADFQGRPPPRREPAKGSFAALVAAYKAAPDFAELGQRTKRDRLIYLDLLAIEYGDLPVAGLTHPVVLALRDKMAATPGKANYCLSVLRRLMTFAVDRGWIAVNPAAKFKRLKTGPGHRPWTEPDVARFEARTQGVVLSAYALAIHTGQRLADVLKMRWDDISEGMVRVRQEKTGEELWIPLSTPLIAVLDGVPKRGLTIVAKNNGQSYTVTGFQSLWHRHKARIDLAHLTFHGLRKTATGRLAEVGCSEQLIKAITGHRTSAMVSHYVAGARQKERAREAIRRLEAKDKGGT